MKISQNRRGFLKTSAAGALGVMALGPMGCTTAAAVDKKSFGVGLQLYSIRDAMDEDVPGSGLGLAITQDILDIYNGHMEIENLVPHGLKIEVVLPSSGEAGGPASETRQV